MKTLKLFGAGAALFICSLTSAQSQIVGYNAPGYDLTGGEFVPFTQLVNSHYAGFGTNRQIIMHNWEVGLRFMPGFSSFKVRSADGVTSAKLALGYGFGLMTAYNFNEHIALQLEILYNTISQKYRDRSIDRRVFLNYINVPLLFSLNSDKTNNVNWNFVIGPQFGWNVGAKTDASGGESTTDTLQAVLAVRKADVGLAYGAGVDFALNDDKSLWLDLGFRGVFGILDISDKSKTTTTNQYYILDRANVKTYAAYVGIKYAF